MVELRLAETFEHIQFIFFTRGLREVDRLLPGSPQPLFSRFKQWFNEEQRRTREIFIIYTVDIPVGYCQVAIMDSEVVLEWVIHPAYQGNGYGEKAAKSLIEHAGVYKKDIMVEVLESNYRGIASCTALGFSGLVGGGGIVRMLYCPKKLSKGIEPPTI